MRDTPRRSGNSRSDERLPAALFLLRSRQLGFSERERRVWRNLSFAAFGFLVLLVVVLSSAAVDRLALYTIPLQVAVFSRPSSVFTAKASEIFLVIAYAAAVQFTWLTFAHHARYWVPYHELDRSLSRGPGFSTGC